MTKKYIPAKSGRAEDITPDQYQIGLELARAGNTVNAICAATGMTKSQVNWCAAKGDASMPAWSGVLSREYALMRQHSIDTAKFVGTQAQMHVKASFEISAAARDSIKIIQHTFRDAQVKELQAAKAEGRDMDQSVNAMSKGTMETLKVLLRTAALGREEAALLGTLIGAAKALDVNYSTSSLTKEARETLAPEALLPAVMSSTEPAKDNSGSSVDLVHDLLSADFDRGGLEAISEYISDVSHLDELSADFEED